MAKAAARGVELLSAKFEVEGRKNVNFDRAGYRSYSRNVRDDPTSAALAAALTAEAPAKRDSGLYAAPLVMMFGQGHQNFLERLVAVSRGETPEPASQAQDTTRHA